MSRSTRSTISPARPRRSTISTIRCRRPRPVGARRHQHAGARQAAASAGSSRPRPAEVYGDPACPSADRGLLGQRQSDRPALLLRRRQALRRDAVLRLSPPARPARSRSRASSTPMGRACIPTTGAWCRISSSRRCKGEPITIYRRRQPDPLVLLCRRSDRGLHAADGAPATRSPARSISAIPANSPSPARRAGDRRDRGANRKLIFKPLPQDDPKQRQPDITLAQPAARLGAEDPAGATG